MIDAVQRVKAISTPRSQLALRLFRLAEKNDVGFTIVEHPRFGLKTARRPERLHLYHIQNIAYKVLTLRPREYLDVKTISDKARELGILRGVVTELNELSTYRALTDKRFSQLFSKRGSLTLSIGGGQEVNGPPQGTRRARPPRESSAIAQNIHEANLEALIADNLDCVESGLTLVGRQHPAPPVGRIDLLCRDHKGNLVVIEIKRLGASTDSVIDQVTRYIGWAQRHIAARGQLVRGVVVVGRPDPKLAYSVRAIPNLSIKVFSVGLQSYSGEEVDPKGLNARVQPNEALHRARQKAARR